MRNSRLGKMVFQAATDAGDRLQSIPLKRIMLLNPNTSPRITDLLQQAALRSGPLHCTIVTRSVAAGPAALRDAADLAVAEREVLAVARAQSDLDGMVIAAFGDPGLEAARAVARFPVVGLGASGLMAAAAHERFSILTLGPQMDATIRARVAGFGFARQLAGLRYLAADIPDVAKNPERFLSLIEAEARIAASEGAQALLLGGAPFAGLGHQVCACIPVIDGLRAAIDKVLAS